MAFPEAFVDEVKRAADVVRVISEHVSLRRAGSSWKGLCPFHQEKSPSFNVRSEPPLFHCFGCGEGGDVFKFVMLHERVSFPEAVEMLARRFGVPLPDTRVEPGPDRKERESLLALLEAAAQHFERSFWTEPGAKAREYLLGRGFEKQTLQRIRAGAAADSWSELLDALRRSFPLELLLKAGLVLSRQDARGHYDRFRNRAVFPIANEAGKVVGFGARSLDGSEPKYLNSPESPVYQKSRVLYGLHWARDAARREGRLVLMEGYLDVARALERGLDECAATCGTALTSAHARLVRRFAERVVLNFDQDDAGQKATRKAADLLLEEGLEVRVLELPQGEDPDSYLRSRPLDEYRQRLEQAPLYLEWLIRRAAAEHDLRTPPGKSAFLNAILPSLGRIDSPVERAAWLPTIVETGGLDEAAAREELRRALASRRASVSLPATTGRAKQAGQATLLPAEKMLLSLIAAGDRALPPCLAALEDADLEGLASAELLRAGRELARHGSAITADSLAEAAAGDATGRLLREIALVGPPADALSADECVRSLKGRALEARLKELQARIGRADEAALDALLREKHEITRRMAGLQAQSS